MNSTGIHAHFKGNLSRSSAHIQSGRAVKFMSAASAVACAIALTSAAAAQSVPVECDAPNPLASGSTILCVASGTIVGPVVGSGVEDLTIVVGDTDTATTLTSGASSTAVEMAGAGAQTLTVTNAGSVVTGTDVGVHIEVTGGAGALTVNSEGTISGGATGIRANNSGTGVTSITTADVSGSASGIGRGVDVNGNGGDIVVDTTAGTVTGGNVGIYVDQYGIGGISITTADVTSVSGDAIYAYTNSSTAGNVVIDTSAGVISGAIGIEVENSGNGGVFITTADVVGTANDAIQVDADSGDTVGGDIAINTVAGSVTGADNGIDVDNDGPGGVSITTANVTSIGRTYYYDGNTYTYGDSAIEVNNSRNSTGDVTINTVAGTVNGADVGIDVYSGGVGSVSITTAAVSGGEGFGIEVVSGESAMGDVTINTVAGAVVGGEAGISVENNGTGGISITTADVSATGGSYGDSYSSLGGVGIRAQSGGGSTGGIVIDSSAGTVTGVGVGVYAENSGQGGIGITTADVSGGFAGVIGNNRGDYGEGSSLGGVAIDTSAGTVTGKQAGILAVNSGMGSISITTADVSATGSYGESYSPLGGIGIRAQSGGGSTGGIVIDSSAGTVTGAGIGIYAASQSQDGIDITAADVSGGFAGVVGINRNYYGEGSSLGDVVIDTRAGTVTGGYAGILAVNDGMGSINITTADVSATGGSYGEAYSLFGGAGIRAQSMDGATGDITINSSAGAVTAVGVGVYAENRGQGGIDITTADVSGGPAGVHASNRGYYGQGGSLGGIRVDTSAGVVTGEHTGIYAYNEGVGSVTVTTGDVTGGYVGIQALNGRLSEGGIVINSAGTVSGDDVGIQARAGAGDISITANNVTSVTGPAIVATIVSGVLTRAPVPISDSAGNLVVNTNGTVVGGSAGILLENFGTGTSTVNNAGIVSATDGPAILALGAPATVNNSGTLNGFVTLTDGDDRFNNTGLFNAGLGNDFGAGTDVFNNSGTLAVTTQAPVELAGVENFNNSGLVDLRNGQTGTVLTLPGDYVGSGNALLGIDIDNGASGATSDVLVIVGAATGRTGVVVNVLGSAGNELGLENLLLVDAGAGSSASAFTIATGFEEQGFLRLGVKFNEGANSYVLVLGPSLAAHRTSLYAEGMRNLWYKTADSWSRHMASVRNTPVEPGATYWISAVGEFSERDNQRTLAFNDSIQTYDLGYNQDYFGTQLGVDLNGGGGFTFGLTGGYLSSVQKFNGSSDRVKYNAVNIGAYAGFTSGIVFANVLAKYDRVWADARSTDGRFDETLEGGVYGARAEVGLTFGDAANGFYAEPAASISYIGSNLDRLVTEQGSVEFVEDEGLLGKFGGRVGYAGFAGTSLYLGANLVHEFAGDDSVILRAAGRSFPIANSAERDYAETMVGVNLGDPSGKTSGVFELRYADGGDHKGFGGSATVNFKF